MTDSQLYNQILSGGAFSLPFLLHLWNDKNSINVYLINDARSLEYEGNVYQASTFSFSPSDTGESSLDITVLDNDIKMLLDGEYSFQAEFTGLLMENGEVSPIRSWKRHYGNAEWDGMSAQITFTGDDRLNMTWPPLTFNGDNNRGNI